MQNNLILIAALITLSGCATTAREPVITTVIQKVEIPIAVACIVETPNSPEFNFGKLKEDQDLFDKAKAVLADRKLHIAYEEELLAALKSCKGE